MANRNARLLVDVRSVTCAKVRPVAVPHCESEEEQSADHHRAWWRSALFLKPRDLLDTNQVDRGEDRDDDGRDEGGATQSKLRNTERHDDHRRTVGRQRGEEEGEIRGDGQARRRQSVQRTRQRSSPEPSMKPRGDPTLRTKVDVLTA